MSEQAKVDPLYADHPTDGYADRSPWFAEDDEADAYVTLCRELNGLLWNIRSAGQ